MSVLAPLLLVGMGLRKAYKVVTPANSLELNSAGLARIRSSIPNKVGGVLRRERLETIDMD